MPDPHDADPVRASLAEIAALLAPAHPDVAEEVLAPTTARTTT